MNQDKIVGQIFETTDYKKFQILGQNRDFVKSNLRKIKNEIEKVGQLAPIIVNEFFEVIDGQHRLKVLIDLALPVLYIIKVGARIKHTISVNSAGAIWVGKNFIDTHSNNAEYQKIKEFQAHYPEFTTKPTLSLLVGTSAISNELREGKIKIQHTETAYKNANSLRVIGRYFKNYYTITFVNAFLKVQQNTNFDFDTFIEKLELQSYKLRKCVNSNDYIELIEEIYNYRNRHKVNLRF